MLSFRSIIFAAAAFATMTSAIPTTSTSSSPGSVVADHPPDLVEDLDVLGNILDRITPTIAAIGGGGNGGGIYSTSEAKNINTLPVTFSKLALTELLASLSKLRLLLKLTVVQTMSFNFSGKFLSFSKLPSRD